MHYWRSVIVGTSVLIALLISAVLVFYWSNDSCPVGTFACSSHNKCVPQRSVCNSFSDCPDDDDEDPVICADLYGSVNMINQMYEYMYNSSLEAMKRANECDIVDFPINCICEFSFHLSCIQIYLHVVPQNISPQVTHLNLANNSIENLNKNSFSSYVDLKVIQLSGNNLGNIPPLVFQKQKKLEKLYLMSNNIEIIQKGVFTGLESLIWLFLDKNRISSIYLDDLAGLVSLEWLVLSNNKLTLDQESFPAMPKLMEIFIDHNDIGFVRNQTFEKLTNIELLSLRKNKIEYVEPGAFRSLTNLRELDLYDNKITRLPSEIFQHLTEVTKMYLGKNPFTYVPSNLFKKLQKLSSLNMEDIEINNIDLKMFAYLTELKSIYFKKYHYCAYAPKVPRCRPLSDGISSMKQLLMKPIFRYSTWIICILTCIGNAMVLWGRYVFRDENKVLSMVVKNLAVSDFLMGVYLLVIAIQDMKYRDIYNLQAHNWISSWTCTVLGVIAMLSSEVSVLLLVFMSVDRFLLIAIPFGRYTSLNVRETLLILTCIWFAGSCIAVMPVIELLSSTRYYGVNGLCFPLHIEDPYFIGWKISAIIFFGINATSLILIGLVYIGMFVSIWKTQKAASLPMRDFEFAIRFFFIVLTDASCWLPIILIKVVAYFGMQISADLYGWLVLFILPINSALNPLLYTFTTPKYRAQINKGLPHMTKQETLQKKHRMRRPSPQSTSGESGSLQLTSRSAQSLNGKIIITTF